VVGNIKSAIARLTNTTSAAKIPKETKGMIGVKLVAMKASAVVEDVRNIAPIALLRLYESLWSRFWLSNGMFAALSH